MLLSICPSKVCLFLDPLCSGGHTSTWTRPHEQRRYKKKGLCKLTSKSTGALVNYWDPTYSPGNTNTFKTSLYLHEKNVKKKRRWQQQWNFHWKHYLTGTLRFIIPPLSVLMQSQKKYCHQLKRITAFVYFRMSLCQKSKYTIVFCFLSLFSESGI